MAGDSGFRRRGFSRRRNLVALQLAVSVALLAVGSVFVLGFVRFNAHDPGFDLSQTAFATFELEYRWADDTDASRRFLERFRDAARAQPGTTAASILNALPFGNPGPSSVWLAPEEKPLLPIVRETPGAELLVGDPDGLAVLGIPLVRGRFFDGRDAAGAPLSTVISVVTASQLFGTTDVIGRRIRFITQAYAGEPQPAQTVATIVGLIADTDVNTIGRRGGLMFLPFAQFRQFDRRSFIVAARTADPAASASALSVLARRLDDEVVTYVNTGPKVIANEAVPTRIGSAVTAGLGTLAFLLAVVGLYGVMSHLVAMRTREIGIRMALGAEARRVVRLFLREGAIVVIAGASIGVLAAYWLVTFLRGLIFGLDRQDPFVLASATLVLALTALVACWIPARRAARVEPNVALRHL